MKKLIKYFIQGLFLITPVGITIYILYWAGSMIDNLASGLLPILDLPRYPGIGILVAIVLVTLLGLFSRYWLSKKLFGYIDKLFTAVPLVKIIYTTVRDVISTVSEGKKGFSKLALVNLPHSEIKLLGYITNEQLESFGLEGYVSVYVMQSMQWAGNLILVPKDMVTVLDIPVEESIKFIASAGLVKNLDTSSSASTKNCP